MLVAAFHLQRISPDLIDLEQKVRFLGGGIVSPDSRKLPFSSWMKS